MTSPDPAAYVLPAEEAERIYRERIRPTVFGDVQGHQSPTMVLLSAPPGAGKSTLAHDIKASFPRDSRPVVLDVDSFRPFYPGYLSLRQEHGWMVDDLVQADARRWFDMALNEAASRQVNVIVEHGLRDMDVTNAVLGRFARSSSGTPYRIEAARLATPAAQSRLGMLERYQVGQERSGFGRYVADEVHDARYRHLLQAASWLDADPRVNVISVYRRGVAEPVHRNERRSDETWPSSVPSAEAITAERQRPWSLQESRAFLRLHHSLEARMGPEWQPNLAHAREDANPLLHPAAGVPNHDKPAVTFGRYQIVSIAHLDTIRTILMDWPKVEVGVLDLDTRPSRPPVVADHLQEFYRGCEANTSPTKNPMAAEERMRFWEATIAAAGLQDRVSVRVITRPELDPGSFNSQYPPDKVDLVFPTASGEGFDRIRNDSFAEILQRPVFPVDPPLEYHTSDIRAAFRAGSEAWKNGFAPGGLDAFLAVDGPRRLLGEAAAPDPAAMERATRSAMHGFPPLQRVKAAGASQPPTTETPTAPRRPGRGLS